MAKLMVSFFDQFPSYNDRRIEIRGKDGYFDATDMSVAMGKRFRDWSRTDFANRLLQRLSDRSGLPITRDDPRSITQTPLIDHLPGRGQNIYLHPYVAMSYAMAVPEFQADVNIWIVDLMTIGTINPHVLKWTHDEVERGNRFNRDDVDDMYGSRRD